VRAVARVLFTDYLFPFEVTSVLLIVAAIAAMVMTRRKARGVPDQDEIPSNPPATQLEASVTEPAS
jgi:NADH-quinone oxidoreductase subunit J